MPNYPKYRITNYQALDPEQKTEVVRILSAEHVYPDEDKSLDPGYLVSAGEKLTVLLKEKNGKTQPIAAISTEGKHVFNWAGKLDKDFVERHGHTPAEELIRKHVARQNGKFTFAFAIDGYPANSLRKRLLEPGGGTINRDGDIRTVTINKAFLKKMKPALTSERKAWETPVGQKSDGFFKRFFDKLKSWKR